MKIDCYWGGTDIWKKLNFLTESVRSKVLNLRAKFCSNIDFCHETILQIEVFSGK